MKSGGNRNTMPPNPGSRVEYDRQGINPKKQIFKYSPDFGEGVDELFYKPPT